MKKNILVLGGSYLQSNFVESALNNYFNVHVMDANSNCYLSDSNDIIFSNINFSDLNKVLKYSHENQIKNIFSPSNEVGNLVAAKLSTELGFNYNDVDVVNKTLKKDLQRNLIKKLNFIKSPEFFLFHNVDEIILDKLNYPLVLKPTNSSASRGVTCVYDDQSLKSALVELNKYLNKDSKILLEQKINGEQLSVETITFNSKHYIVGITKELVSGEPYFIERSHFMGPDIHAYYYDKIKYAIFELLNEMGVQWGPCHIEIKIQDGDVFLIEIASRSGGLRDKLMNFAGYPDYNQLIIDTQFNFVHEPILNNPKQNSLVNILLYEKDFETVNNAKNNNVFCDVYLNNNKIVDFPQNISEAYGYAYFKSEKNIVNYSLL